MRLLLLVMFLLNWHISIAQKSDTIVTQAGWLIIYGREDIVFMPVKASAPTYDNFFKEKTDTGFRLNDLDAVYQFIPYAKPFPIRDIVGDSLGKCIFHDINISIVPVSFKYNTAFDSIYNADLLEQQFMYAGQKRQLAYLNYFDHNIVSMTRLSSKSFKYKQYQSKNFTFHPVR